MIAVTGAAGFIGSNLAHKLAELGHELLLVDHPLPATKPANWAGLNDFRFLDHERFLASLSNGSISPKAIFHLGACSSTTETRWDYLERNNIGYTRTLWEWCTKHTRPYSYASSAATYGDGSLGFDDHTPPEQLTPLNLYGKSKNDFDIWALKQKLTPPTWAGLKFFNVYGPREAHKGRMASVVFQAHKQILQTGELKLFRSNDPRFPDGGQLRDFVFVNDNVDHMLWLWQNKHGGGVYNSGTGTARSFFDLGSAVFRSLGLEPNITFIDMPPDLSGKYQNFTEATMTKLREAGCTHKPTRLEDGVKLTVDWLEAQRKS